MSNKGRKLTEEHKAKIAAAHLGKPMLNLRGVNHPNYKHGNNRTKGRVEYKLWRSAVLERDGYKCVMCDAIENLHADHIKPYSLYPRLRLAIDNGRTLCKACHMKHGWHVGSSPKHKKLVSEAMKRIWAEGKRKPPSKEARAKISKTLTGFKHSAEARKNMSEGQKRGYALGHRIAPNRWK